jgi:DNA invertase Pin-like site-specific DNA recombinase
LIHGYARVSTDGQSVHAQVKQLRAAGAEKVWRETASGAKTDRAQLRRLLDQLDACDVLLITRLDRLARSTRAAGSCSPSSAAWPSSSASNVSRWTISRLAS